MSALKKKGPPPFHSLAPFTVLSQHLQSQENIVTVNV